jgi:RNA polymerase sigma factor (TIGR02999 family)
MPHDAPVPSEITKLLQRWKEGDRQALASLASLAYDDLHAIATGYLRREAAGHTLQATGLVNELYLRLAKVRGIELADRRHFFTFAAQLMRMILIDYARKSRALKRPGATVRIPLHEEMAWIDASSEEMLAHVTRPRPVRRKRPPRKYSKPCRRFARAIRRDRSICGVR